MGLKIIIHHGQIIVANIKGRTKLIGEDVIITHKLLKNGIEENEYILLTESYLKKIKKSNVTSWFHWDDLKKSSDEYDHIGEVEYRYIPFGEEHATI